VLCAGGAVGFGFVVRYVDAERTGVRCAWSVEVVGILTTVVLASFSEGNNHGNNTTVKIKLILRDGHGEVHPTITFTK
jgi:hypothetical protein